MGGGENTLDHADRETFLESFGICSAKALSRRAE